MLSPEPLLQDPFAVLDLSASMDLCSKELDKTYLRLSRETHPDFHGQGSAAEQVAVLSRSAQINDAYHCLQDSWRRAEAFLELAQPGIMQEHKQLCPMFLMEAMENAEEVAHARIDPKYPDLAGLQNKLQTLVAESLQGISDKIASNQLDAAAELLHQSVYHRKALDDLHDNDLQDNQD